MNSVRIVKESLLGYVAWTGVHWVVSNMYVKMCTPYSGWGLVQTLYLSQSPGCNMFRWASHISANTMDQAFTLSASWCLLRLSYHAMYFRDQIVELRSSTSKLS